jgi:hypothetical protein
LWNSGIGGNLTVLFAAAALASAFLLFWVEPLFTRLVLPLLGGSPSVWNTCLMYFQALLLVGYLYAHASTRYLSPRRQLVLHMTLLAIAAIALPLGLPSGWTPPASSNVIPWLLGALTVSVGAPFLILSATAPLLQRWLAGLDKPVENPYALYAASNAGSFLGLLAFPVVFEPMLTLGQQSKFWSILYAAAFVLTGACCAVAWRRTTNSRATPRATTEKGLAPGWSLRAKWIALAFVPSSLLLSVTTFLSTDVAATPLLWVIPLSIYLLTFVVVFSSVGFRLRVPAAFLHAAVISILAMVIFWEASIGFRWSYALNLSVFALTALVLHGELAASRPAPLRLTEYYLWMALGGALGGAFTALIVPMIFRSTRDYFMMLVIACFLRPSADKRITPQQVAIALVPAIFLAVVKRPEINASHFLGLRTVLVVSSIAIVGVFWMRRHSLRFGIAIAAIIAGGLILNRSFDTIFSDRSFFGIYRVMRIEPGVTILFHGSTIHGAQFSDSARRLTPITYYHPDGPLGDVFHSLQQSQITRNVGVVGLGTGTVLCYSRPEEKWTFFEIDPHVEAIARNQKFFTYLSGCAVRPRIVTGDARLTLAREPAGRFSMLILDAFSSDAIPVHLLTLEAFRLYEHVLTDDGVLMVHISNRRLALEPVVGRVAAELGMVALIRNYDSPDKRQNRDYDYSSDWVAVAKNTAALGSLENDRRWRELYYSPSSRPWSDDYSNIISVIKWK